MTDYVTATSQAAEAFFLRAGLPQNAVDMYIRADQWEPAYQIAVECMEEKDVVQLYVSQAQQLEGAGRLKEAERMYVIVGQPDLAISMYRKHKQVL